MNFATHWLHEDQREVKRLILAWRVLSSGVSVVRYDPWLDCFFVEP